MPPAAVHFALSLSGKVQEYGGWAGFAAVLGLGVLSMLYFAQAREVKRLREWAGRAPERAIELEQQRAAAQAPSRVVPQPVARPATVAAPAATAVAAQVAAPAARDGAGTKVVAPVTAAGAAAAGDAAFERPVSPIVAAGAVAMVPAASAPPVSASGPTASTAAPATVAGNGAGNGTGSPAAVRPPAVTPAAAAATGAPVRPPQPLRTGTAQATLPPGGPAGPAGARAAGASPSGRMSRLSPTLRRVVPIAAGVLLVALIAVAVGIVVLGGGSGSSPKSNSVGQQPVASTSGSQSRKSTGSTTKRVTPSHVTVSVLNGTTITGLAAQETNKLAQAGFKTNQPTNDTTNQTRSATAVFYMPNNRGAALAVAKALGVASDAVQPIDPSTRLLVNPNAQQVVVSLGSDQGQ